MVHDADPMTLPELRAFLEQHLREDIVPFWLRHAIDRERGGIFSCISPNCPRHPWNRSNNSSSYAFWNTAIGYGSCTPPTRASASIRRRMWRAPSGCWRT